MKLSVARRWKRMIWHRPATCEVEGFRCAHNEAAWNDAVSEALARCEMHQMVEGMLPERDWHALCFMAAVTVRASAFCGIVLLAG